ncbi:hypothetical protein DCC39_10740 [Pueribacillus theae]|uniref:Amino acid permease n=1 Tax=Pueribacillus theae TaxID=2171751 RepID=A0A2U1JZV2_9BACI|nr:APC family permease [Pueribacillus theae]PWA10756.1 hypothetical protein DCC39_10740 [Pueribacillus theae]
MNTGSELVQSEVSKKTGTEQKMGLIGAIAVIVGSMVGASIFAFLGSIAAKTGSSLYIVYLIAVIPAIFGSVAYLQLGAMFPESGGTYHYNKKLLSPFMGLLAGLSILFAAVGVLSTMSIALAQFLQMYLPNAPLIPTSLGVLALFFIINFFGLKTTNAIQVIMVIWMIAALLIFAFPGLIIGEPAPPSDLPFLSNGFSGLFIAAALASFAYAGYNIITELGGNIKNPKRNLPLSIIISLLLVALIYFFVTLAVSRLVPAEELATGDLSLTTIATQFLSPGFVTFIGIGALLALATTLNVAVMIIPQELNAIAKDGLAPKIFTKLHGKNEIPTAGLITGFVFGVLLILSGISLDASGLMITVGFLAAAVFTGFGARKAPKLFKSDYEAAEIRIRPRVLSFFCWAGILSSLFFIFFSMVDAPLVMVAYIVLVIAAYVYHKWINKNNLNVEE